MRPSDDPLNGHQTNIASGCVSGAMCADSCLEIKRNAFVFYLLSLKNSQILGGGPPILVAAV